MGQQLGGESGRSRASCIYSIVLGSCSSAEDGNFLRQRQESRGSFPWRSIFTSEKLDDDATTFKSTTFQSKAVSFATRSWKRFLQPVEVFIRAPLTIKQASTHALNRWRRTRRLRSMRYTTAFAPPQSHNQTIVRKRESYIRQLGITRKSKARHKTMASSKITAFLAASGEERANDACPSTSSENLPSLCISTGSSKSKGLPFEASSSADSQVRMRFLQKLSYEKVWLPKVQRAPPHQTVIIFDWDDTLLCTSFLKQLQGAPLPREVVPVLKAIETSATDLLEQALGLGHTFIITNAASGWVEQSAFEHFSNLRPVLDRVHVVSARSRYESEYPNKVSLWKTKTFLDIQKQLGSEVIGNLVSLGDSCFEMEAAFAMGQEFEQAVVKTIKFLSCPSPESLARQLELVSRQFTSIVGSARNLRVRMKPTDCA